MCLMPRLPHVATVFKRRYASKWVVLEEIATYVGPGAQSWQRVAKWLAAQTAEGVAVQPASLFSFCLVAGNLRNEHGFKSNPSNSPTRR